MIGASNQKCGQPNLKAPRPFKSRILILKKCQMLTKNQGRFHLPLFGHHHIACFIDQWVDNVMGTKLRCLSQNGGTEKVVNYHLLRASHHHLAYNGRQADRVVVSH